VNKYTAAPARAIPFEKFREDWQRQIIADPELSFVTVRVALVISWHMNGKKGGLAWPGMKRLALIARTTPRTVIRATKSLEAAGYLRIIRSHQEKRRGRNHYTPLLKRFEQKRSNPSPGSDQAMSLGGDQVLSPGSDQAMSHKPPIEPPTKPPREHPAYTASVSTDADSRKVEEKGSGEEERKITPLHAKPNPTARCFGLAEKWWPKDRALVAKALKNYPAAEVLAELEFAIKEGCDIRDVLAGMVADYDAA
jgi:DNA-binding MarR family transcriptional regulator